MEQGGHASQLPATAMVWAWGRMSIFYMFLSVRTETIIKKEGKTMAKKFPFTRTISSQKVDALVFDKETAEPFNMVVHVAPVVNDESKLEKAVAKLIDNEQHKFIDIVHVELVNKCYGVTLEDFMAAAVELDPETRKPLSENPAINTPVEVTNA